MPTGKRCSGAESVIRGGRDRVIATATRRVGEDATRHLWLVLKYGFTFPWITPIWFILLFLGFQTTIGRCG